MVEDTSLYIETAVKVVLQRVAETVAEMVAGLQRVDGRVAVKPLRCTAGRHCQ